MELPMEEHADIMRRYLGELQERHRRDVPPDRR